MYTMKMDWIEGNDEPVMDWDTQTQTNPSRWYWRAWDRQSVRQASGQCLSIPYLSKVSHRFTITPPPPLSLHQGKLSKYYLGIWRVHLWRTGRRKGDPVLTLWPPSLRWPKPDCVTVSQSTKVKFHSLECHVCEKGCCREDGWDPTSYVSDEGQDLRINRIDLLRCPWDVLQENETDDT